MWSSALTCWRAAKARLDLVRFGGKGGVTIAPVARDELTVSSTAIREALTRGAPREAAAMLGHWHRVDGR